MSFLSLDSVYWLNMSCDNGKSSWNLSARVVHSIPIHFINLLLLLARCTSSNFNLFHCGRTSLITNVYLLLYNLLRTCANILTLLTNWSILCQNQITCRQQVHCFTDEFFVIHLEIIILEHCEFSSMNILRYIKSGRKNHFFLYVRTIFSRSIWNIQSI